MRILTKKEYIFKALDAIKNDKVDPSRQDFIQTLYNMYGEYTKYFHNDYEVNLSHIETYKRNCRRYYVEWLNDNGETNKSLVPFRSTEDCNTIKSFQDGSKEIIYTASEIRTVEQLVDFAGIELTDEWEIREQTVNSYGNSKNGQYQVKARIVKKIKDKSDIDYKELREDLLQSIKDYSPKPQKIKYKKSKDKSLLYEIAIFDHHFGQIALDKGKQIYNPEIAKNIMIEAVTDLLSKVDLNKIDRILFPLGQDFFNTDNKMYCTTGGTRQDEFPSWKYTFIEGRKLIVTIIDMLKQVAPVDIKLTPGNHDTTRIFYLGDVIEAWYKDDSKVTVDNNIDNPRKYYKFGANLIGFTHSDKEVKGSLPMLMATENPIWWSQTKFREWHSGHLHHSVSKQIKLSDEILGVKERTLPTLCSKNEWSKEKGYLDTRESIGFLWHPKYGKIAENYYHVD